MRPDRPFLSRREFLHASAVAAAMAGRPARALAQGETLGAEEATAPIAAGTPALSATLLEADGSPLDAERLKTLHVRDLANDPLPQAINISVGNARVELAREPLQFSVRLKVPGFGEVYCYADNDGRGYAKPGSVDYIVAAAQTRLRRVRLALQQARRAGVPRDAEIERHLALAARPLPAAPALARTAAAYESLAHGLHAGEKLTLQAARHRIARLAQPRRDFQFGCLMAGFNRFGPEYEQRLSALFNFATVSWYTWKDELPEEKRIDYTRMDDSINWCRAHGITPKGFGYVYLSRGATPEWIRAWPYEKVLPEYERVVAQTLRRYRDTLHHVEVINEAHDKTNLWRFSHAQILELTRAACRAARQGSPTVRRQINHCCLWAEYAKRRNEDGTRRWSPYRYLQECVASGVEFETIGLQLYYPSHDLFEIERMLDRFKAFKRPIHITEMAAASVDGLDPNSMRPKTLTPGWHGPWTETMQADWLEAIYTLCYSKPEFEAVGWWDLADTDGHFWPYGGLLHKDMTPKESYFRLQKLQRDWGVAKPTASVKTE